MVEALCNILSLAWRYVTIGGGRERSLGEAGKEGLS